MFTAWIYISNVEMGSRGYLCVKLLRSKLDTDVASKTGGNYWKKDEKDLKLVPETTEGARLFLAAHSVRARATGTNWNAWNSSWT